MEITTREEQVLKDSQRKKRADEVDGGRGEITAGAVRPLHMQNNTSIPLTAEQERARAEEAERREKEEQEKRDFRNATAFLLFKALPTGAYGQHSMHASNAHATISTLISHSIFCYISHLA